MTTISDECEVLVIGGGPAGSTAALRLQELGHDVCLVEAARFPRRRVGESLGASILPILETLGLRGEVEAAGFLRPRGARIHWIEPRTSDFDPEERGLNVDRGLFDSILLEAARRAGVSIVQPARAGPPAPDPARRGGWRVPVYAEDGEDAIRCRFLVDAAGRSSPSRASRKAISPPLLAIHAYWRGLQDAGDYARVEAADDAWYWGAPLPDGSFSAAVFIDPREHSRALRGRLEDYYRERLEASSLLGRLAQCELDSPVRACDATSRLSAQLVAKDLIRVGEGAYTVDPLSAQGVRAAILSSIHAAAVVHTMLVEPRDGGLAMAFYETRQRAAVLRQANEVARWYAEKASQTPSRFWLQRCRSPRAAPAHPRRMPLDPDARLVLAPEASLHESGVLEGDRIASHIVLSHPSLPEEVGFVCEKPVSQLLAHLADAPRAKSLVARWSPLVGPERAHSLLVWMWRLRIVIARGLDQPHSAAPS